MKNTTIALTRLFCILFAVCSNSIAFGDRPTEIVEVIYELPTSETSNWHIGGTEYETNDATSIDTDTKPIVGNLAIVEFETIENRNIATTITPLAISSASINDGPYLFSDENNQITSLTMQNGVVKKLTLPAPHELLTVPADITSVPEIAVQKFHSTSPPSTYSMPKKLLAVSDIEGNIEHLIQFLQFHEVIDMQCNWSWGTNHLLFNGDSVDRGDKVTELLWFMRKLQQQALKEGGVVHVVLGNHEAMILANDIRYTHPKYKFVAKRMGIEYHNLFSEQSVLGNWLRAQNSFVQVGDYLFVHAGYGPELDSLQLTGQEINSQVRQALGPPAWPEKTKLENSLVWHSKGPLWYRGYFDKHSKKYGPKPTSEEIDSILLRHHANTIVVGHTVTGTIGWLDGDKRLIGIDVHWDTDGEGQGLLISDGKQIRVTMTETDAQLESISTSVKQ
jgi:predicted RecA/RadA family phage recombinase